MRLRRDVIAIHATGHMLQIVGRLRIELVSYLRNVENFGFLFFFYSLRTAKFKDASTLALYY